MSISCWIARFASSSSLALALVACASSPEARLDEPLPFRVAVRPVEISDQGELSVAIEASASDEESRLWIREEELTESLVDALRGRGFADVLTLTYGEGETPETVSSEQWAERARLAGADLLLDVTLLYEPGIDGGINEKFWLNLPLFALGGPFCYFIDDRTYAAAARMQAQFVCLNEAPRGATVLPLPLQVDYTGSQLDFTDRAGSSVGAYASSLLVPAGLLWPNSERIPEEVSEDAIDQLAAALFEQVAIQQQEFNHNDRLAHFELDLGACSAQRADSRTVRFRAAILDPGERGLKKFVVSSAGSSHEGDLSGLLLPRHEIEVALDSFDSERFVRLEVHGGLHVRSYTFPIEPAQ